MAEQNIFQKAASMLGFTGTKTASPTKIIGASGTAVYGGYVQENEANSSLTGREKYKTYINITINTSIVSAGVRYYLNLVQKAGWTFSPADDSAQAEEYAEEVTKILHDMETPWSRVVRRAAMYKFYGFSVQEWTAKKRDDGIIGLLDISPRAQITIDRWDIDEFGRVHGMTQTNPQTQKELYLPRSKVLYIVDDSLNDSPEGLGILRNLVEPVKRLQRYEQLEGFGYESDLRGVPVGRAPYALINEQVAAGLMTREDAETQFSVLTTFINKHIKNPERGIVLDSSVYETANEAEAPSGQPLWDISLLENSGQGLEEVAAAIERINHEIARLIGVEQLLLGQSRGTQALSEDKSHNFAMVVGSALGEIAETVNRDIIARLGELNGWDPDLLPKAKCEEIQFKSPTQITEALAGLARSMLDPEDPAINVIRDMLGLPDALVNRDALDSSLQDPGGTKAGSRKDVEDEDTDDLDDQPGDNE